MLRFEKFVCGKWKENCYVVSTTELDAIVVDPGGELDAIKSYIAANNLRVHAILNTHAHYDHLGAVVPLQTEFNIPFYLHSADEKLLRMANFYRKLFLGEETILIPKLDIDLADKTKLSFGSLEVNVLHTPGHTPGSVCFVISGEIFTGDTIMAKYVGRTDLPGGDREALDTSIQRLSQQFPGATRIHPGHGESSTLGEVFPKIANHSEYLG